MPKGKQIEGDFAEPGLAATEQVYGGGTATFEAVGEGNRQMLQQQGGGAEVEERLENPEIVNVRDAERAPTPHTAGGAANRTTWEGSPPEAPPAARVLEAAPLQRTTYPARQGVSLEEYQSPGVQAATDSARVNVDLCLVRDGDVLNATGDFYNIFDLWERVEIRAGAIVEGGPYILAHNVIPAVRERFLTPAE